MFSIKALKVRGFLLRKETNALFKYFELLLNPDAYKCLALQPFHFLEKKWSSFYCFAHCDKGDLLCHQQHGNNVLPLFHCTILGVCQDEIQTYRGAVND